MSIDLSPELEVLIRDRLQSGRYSTEGDVLREALQLLGRRDELRAQVQIGLTQLEEGSYSEYGENDFDRFMADIAAAEARINGSQTSHP